MNKTHNMAEGSLQISQLTVAEAISGNELIPFAKDRENGSLTVQQLKEYVVNGIKTQEAERVSAETQRQTAEADRAKAESGRAAEFATYRPLIDAKQVKLTDSEDITLRGSELSVTERAKRTLFDDLWRTAVGTYGKVDHTHADSPYYLNELWLTYEEAVAIYYRGAYETDNAKCKFKGDREIRTTLPPSPANYVQSSALTYSGCANLEVVLCSTLIPIESNFRDCKKLRKISGLYSINSNVKELYDPIYKNCESLEDIKFSLVYPISFSLQWSPKLAISVFQTIVAKYNGTTVITVTVHPEVYAKLTDTANAEWHRVLTDGAAKNISFATITE